MKIKNGLLTIKVVAAGEGSTPTPVVRGLHFYLQSVVRYMLCRHCRENAVAVGKGKEILIGRKNTDVIAWRGASSARTVSSADRAYSLSNAGLRNKAS